LHDFGVLRCRQGFLRSAHRAFVAALACKRRFANGADTISSAMNLAKLKMLLGRTDHHLAEMIALLEKALIDASAANEPEIRATLADLYWGAEDFESAAKHADRWIETMKTRGTREEWVLALSTAARISLSRKCYTAVLNYGREALDVLERHRPFVSPETHSEWQKYGVPIVKALVTARYHSNPAQALDALAETELVKARLLLQKFGRWQLRPPHGFPNELREQEEEVLAQLRMWDHADTLAEHYGQLLVNFRDDAIIGKACGFWEGLPEPWREYGKLRLGRPPDFALLFRRQAERSTAYFIVIYPAETGTFVWLLTPHGEVASWRHIEAREQDLQSLATASLAALQAKQPMPSDWGRFSAMLDEGCLGTLPENVPLCIVPSGPATQLPMALLEVAGHRLLERNPISYLPTLSFLVFLDDEPAKQPPRALVIGDSLADLKWARREASSVAKRFDVKPLLGAQAIRFEMMPALRQCSLLHIACHASFNQEAPEKSGFFLADRSMFSVQDAMKLRLAAPRLAFLSACESGRVFLKSGDEAVGLSAGLLAAGFKTVISTGWQVPDLATSMITERFYAELFDHGRSFSDSLRQAQLSVATIPKYSHPFFWGAFGVTGDWHNPFVKAPPIPSPFRR
jgi:tetratricopeptide (TPR) repeat protein